MRRKLICTLLFMCLCTLAGCGKNNTSEVKIDYGNSKLYTKDDMKEAIGLIKKEFETWEGCELHSIAYVSDDENNDENIEWMNELETANDNKEHFTQCIVFRSEFHSPKKQSGSWEPDQEYTGWGWWLARSEGGAWKLMTWGY